MLSQSCLLTLLGMGIVFLFLIIMIICMYALHEILHAFKMDKDESAENAVANTSGVVSAPVATTSNDTAVVAAIAAAVHDKVLKS